MKFAFSSAFRKPSLLVMPGAAFSIIYIIFAVNPVTNLLSGIIAQTQTTKGLMQAMAGFLGNFIVIFQMAAGFRFFSPFVFVGALLMLAIMALLLAVFFSGYLNCVKLFIEEGAFNLNTFLNGVKIFFKRQFFLNISILLAGMVLTIVMVFCILPAVFLTYSVFIGYKEFTVHMAILDFLTVVVVATGTLFVRIYAYPWAASLYLDNSNLKICMENARDFANANFWQLFSGLLFLDIIYIVYILATALFKFSVVRVVPLSGFTFGGVFVFLVQSVFTACFVAIISVYIFQQYNKTIVKQ